MLVTDFRGVTEEALRNVGNDVSCQLDAGEEHLLEVGLDRTIGLLRQQLRVDGVEMRRLDDGVIVGEQMRRVRRLRLGVDRHRQLQTIGALFELELASEPLVLLEQDFKMLLKLKFMLSNVRVAKPQSQAALKRALSVTSLYERNPKALISLGIENFVKLE